MVNQNEKFEGEDEPYVSKYQTVQGFIPTERLHHGVRVRRMSGGEFKYEAATNQKSSTAVDEGVLFVHRAINLRKRDDVQLWTLPQSIPGAHDEARLLFLENVDMVIESEGMPGFYLRCRTGMKGDFIYCHIEPLPDPEPEEEKEYQAFEKKFQEEEQNFRIRMKMRAAMALALAGVLALAGAVKMGLDSREESNVNQRYSSLNNDFAELNAQRAAVLLSIERLLQELHRFGADPDIKESLISERAELEDLERVWQSLRRRQAKVLFDKKESVGLSEDEQRTFDELTDDGLTTGVDPMPIKTNMSVEYEGHTYDFSVRYMGENDGDFSRKTYVYRISFSHTDDMNRDNLALSKMAEKVREYAYESGHHFFVGEAKMQGYSAVYTADVDSATYLIGIADSAE